jgi:hypothetical protein
MFVIHKELQISVTEPKANEYKIQKDSFSGVTADIISAFISKT